MALGSPIRLRLHIDQQIRYEEAAAIKGVPLGTFLRERLDFIDKSEKQLANLQLELAALRRMLEDLVEDNNFSSSNLQGVEIETLLLLRHLCKPEQRKEVRADMNRLGFDIWNQEEK